MKIAVPNNHVSSAECCDQQIRGMIVHDSHAEVLTRRGLQKETMG